MKVCFDTCFIIDLFGKTKDCFNAFVSLDVAYSLNFQPYCSVSSTTDIAYLMHSRGFATTKQQADKSIENVLNLFTLLDNTEADVRRAIFSNMKDYEDALIAYSCERTGVDIIVTRNKKDFRHSPVPALTPEEFIDAYKPDGYVYEEVLF